MFLVGFEIPKINLLLVFYSLEKTSQLFIMYKKSTLCRCIFQLFKEKQQNQSLFLETRLNYIS